MNRRAHGLAMVALALASLAPPALAGAATTTTTLAPWCVAMQKETFLQVVSVAVATNRSATVKGYLLAPKCAPGTPDDVQYSRRHSGEAPITVHLRPGASLTAARISGRSTPIALRALAHYLAADIDGNLFRAVGPRNAATALLGIFHP